MKINVAALKKNAPGVGRLTVHGNWVIYGRYDNNKGSNWSWNLPSEHLRKRVTASKANCSRVFYRWTDCAYFMRSATHKCLHRLQLYIHSTPLLYAWLQQRRQVFPCALLLLGQWRCQIIEAFGEKHVFDLVHECKRNFRGKIENWNWFSQRFPDWMHPWSRNKSQPWFLTRYPTLLFYFAMASFRILIESSMPASYEADQDLA